MGIRELYEKERKQRVMHRLLISLLFMGITTLSIVIYVYAPSIKSIFEKDSNPIKFIESNLTLPHNGIMSDDPQIPEVLRSKSLYSPLCYYFEKDNALRILSIKGKKSRLKELIEHTKSKWIFKQNKQSVLILHSGTQLIYTPNKNDSATITIVSPSNSK